jgi:hypothetical protein
MPLKPTASSSGNLPSAIGLCHREDYYCEFAISALLSRNDVCDTHEPSQRSDIRENPGGSANAAAVSSGLHVVNLEDFCGEGDICG